MSDRTIPIMIGAIDHAYTARNMLELLLEFLLEPNRQSRERKSRERYEKTCCILSYGDGNFKVRLNEMLS